MGCVHEAVQNRIGEGWIAQIGVPLIKWQLTGHDGGFHADAVIEHLQQISSFGCTGSSESPVVEHDQVGARQRGEFA